MSVSEGGIRVPAVIGVYKFENSKSEKLFTMMDVLPTILDLINYKNETVADGVSR